MCHAIFFIRVSHGPEARVQSLWRMDWHQLHIILLILRKPTSASWWDIKDLQPRWDYQAHKSGRLSWAHTAAHVVLRMSRVTFTLNWWKSQLLQLSGHVWLEAAWGSFRLIGLETGVNIRQRAVLFLAIISAEILCWSRHHSGGTVYWYLGRLLFMLDQMLPKSDVISLAFWSSST